MLDKIHQQPPKKISPWLGGGGVKMMEREHIFEAETNSFGEDYFVRGKIDFGQYHGVATMGLL